MRRGHGICTVAFPFAEVMDRDRNGALASGARRSRWHRVTVKVPAHYPTPRFRGLLIVLDYFGRTAHSLRPLDDAEMHARASCQGHWQACDWNRASGISESMPDTEAPDMRARCTITVQK